MWPFGRRYHRRVTSGPFPVDPRGPAPGDTLGGRFLLELEVGRGGMGSVFRATDVEGGGRVALKVLTEPSGEAARRFAREAQTLRRLSHPGIVRWVAAGEDPAGPWIAMEWIEGSTLARRLRGGPLTVAETQALARRVGAALAVAHAAGVVHRDIKPENLLLPSARCEEVVLVDFGIARGAIEDGTVTRPGVVIGTPPYMAPEQVRGARDLGPRADLFSLGCVLWECLAGRTLFDAHRTIAVLLRVLVEAAPRLREVVPGVPAELDELIARMLAKDPAERPADGAALVACLEAIERRTELERGRRLSPSNELGVFTTDELRLFSLLVARVPPDDAFAGGATVRVPPPVELGELLRDLSVRAAALGAALHRLADGSIVAFVTEPLPPPELATRAARLAGLVLGALRGWSVVVTTGRGDPAGDLPIGDVVDRATSLWSDGRTVVIDELTAQLVEDSYAVVRTPEGLRLGAARAADDDVQRPRAQSAPFVGRSRELATLRGCLDRAAEERRPRIVTVVGPPGSGKSRLCEQLVRTMAHDVVLLVGRGDPLRRDAPLAMLSDVVRRGLGLPDVSSPLGLRLVLREGLERVLDPGQSAAALELFEELVGVPVSDEEATAALRAARRDPAVLAGRIRDAFVGWLGRYCRVAPVALVLEDMQWADASTLRFVVAAVRALRDCPLLVVGLARPEWTEEGDAVLAGLPTTSIELAPLEPGATRQLAEALLGPHAEDLTVARISRESEGHPLLLEQLARSLGDDPPRAARATALGIVEHRLAARPAEERRVLRAAAVLGSVFWRGAVANLLGESADRASTLEAALASLCAAVIIQRRRGGRFPDEQEYAFLHDLFREAAYETLTPEDRRLGHRRAGRWLQAHGEPDAAVLAEHYTRGDHPRRAARAHLEAARRAGRVGDPSSAASHAARGRELAEDAELRAELDAVLSEALMWQGRLDQARRVGWQALDALRAGSAAWHATAVTLASTISRAPSEEEGRRLAERLVSLGPVDSVDAVLAAAQVAERLVRMGLEDDADRVMACGSTERIRALAEIDPVVEPMWRFATSARQGHRGQTDQAIAGMRWAADRFGELGAWGHRLSALVQLISFQSIVGAYGDLRATLRDTERLARERGARPLVSYCRLTEVHVLLVEGRTREAAAVLEELTPELEQMDDPVLRAYALSLHATATLTLGDPVTALAEAERAAATVAQRVDPVLDVLAGLARILIATDKPRAIEIARRAVASADARGQFIGDDMEPRLVLAEALQAAGHGDEARAAIASARERLRAHAALVQDPGVRRSLCEGVPVNARVLALARAWLGE